MDHHEQLIQQNQIKASRILKSSQLVALTQNLSDLYTLIGQLNNDVLDLYPHIACRTGCNTCCKGTSMPAVSPSEWKEVYSFILKMWSPEQKSDMIATVLDMYHSYTEIIWAIHDNLQQNPSQEKLQKLIQILPKLSDTTCPLLVDEKCSVYASRPAKCRAHGSFLFIFDNYTQLHACQDEVDKMETYLREAGSRKIIMPIWNQFEEKVVTKFNEPGAVSTILLLWLYAHIKEHKFVSKVNLKPDFEHLRNFNEQ